MAVAVEPVEPQCGFPDNQVRNNRCSIEIRRGAERRELYSSAESAFHPAGSGCLRLAAARLNGHGMLRIVRQTVKQSGAPYIQLPKPLSLYVNLFRTCR
jgi:hypothetical protein